MLTFLIGAAIPMLIVAALLPLVVHETILRTAHAPSVSVLREGS
jgi:hypothetical protein